MAIQLKNDDSSGEASVNESTVGVETSSRYGGADDYDNPMESGYRSAEPDLNNLPTYTGPTVNPDAYKGSANSMSRPIIYKVIAGVIILIIAFGLYKGAMYLTGSSGKDISADLTLSEDELATKYKAKFEDNPDMEKRVPQYSSGKVTVRTGADLDVIYIDGKQIGVNTNSRKYRFFGIGINDPEKDALENTTYQYDDSYIVLNDMMGGNSKTYYYYNVKNKDCLVMTVSDRTNRIVMLTYYTNYKKISETLSFD